MPNIRRGDWVVVCDGSKALILENRGNEKHPDLSQTEIHERHTLPTHRLGGAAPGRVYQSFGSARSAVERPDLHDAGERHFLLDLAALLEEALSAGKTKRLIVIAPPRALGMLRSAYPPAVKSAIAAELKKDWVKLPIAEIERRLFA
jgi:protein required for attachment to host cells